MKAIAFKHILTAAVLTATVGISANTIAGHVDGAITDGSAVPARTVSFERSELATAEGRAMVERRIRRAARLVCGSDDHHVAGTLHAVARNEACYDRAVEKAMAQIVGDSVASID
jgi:UrcA family protein